MGLGAKPLENPPWHWGHRDLSDLVAVPTTSSVAGVRGRAPYPTMAGTWGEDQPPTCCRTCHTMQVVSRDPEMR